MHAVAAERIVVPFKGEGAGVDELSWGQTENWSAIVAQKTWIPLGGVKPLPPTTTIEEIADELAYLMGRYQPMRTKLRFAPDGHPRQEVFESGEIVLSIVDAGSSDPLTVAEAICDGWRDDTLDFASEWPVRMALVRKDGVLTHMSVLMSHFVTDAAGALVMMSEVAQRVSAPVAGMQPLEQARWQQSPAGQRQNESSLRHWDNILRTVSPHRFPPVSSPAEPRYWHGEFSSPKLLKAVLDIADRRGTETSTVLFALYAVALNQITGISPVVIRPMVSNRFRPGMSNVVCTLAQAGLCSFDIGGLSFPDALTVVQRSVMAAYKHAYFNHHDMVAFRERIALERGQEINIACYFNDRRSSSRGSSFVSDAPATFRWVASQDAPSFEPLFLHIDDVPGTAQITLYLDSHYFSPADGERLVRLMEEGGAEHSG
ncbi:condensation domain-containing protein [Catelliglobosispora koreensis]|uniref:condensation domain-containing protein n=1 Tax=Catelliglobosispora koreensis TaxID=129052 RepID=UPI0003808A51|nr:condensation domain-containing protein [Catelliglobosispora koreensis]